MLKGIEPKKFGATARARFDDLNLQIEQRIS
jgi:hypothetical protein